MLSCTPWRGNEGVGGESCVADHFPFFFIVRRRERVWPTAIELPVLTFTQGRVSVNWCEVGGQPRLKFEKM